MTDNKIILLISLLIYGFCYFLLTHVFLFWETSWHIEGAKRMLCGGTYLSNLIDDNPPPVFMFYIPYAYLSKIQTLSTPNFASLYILVIYGVGSYFTFQVLKTKLINRSARYYFYFASLVGTLFLGIIIIGERENILLSLFIPYFFMNLFEGNPLSITKQIIIAFLAAIAISQAPFYIFIPIVLDIVDCVAKQKKPDLYQKSFYIVFVAIFIISFFLYPNYYLFLLNILYHFQASLNAPFNKLITNIYFLSIIYALLITIFFAYFSEKKLIYIKIIVSILLTLIIYILEQKNWYYHIYPALFFCISAWALIHIDNKNTPDNHLKQFAFRKVLSFVFAVILLTNLTIIARVYFLGNRAYADKSSYLNRLISFSLSTNPQDNKTLFFNTRVFPAYLLKLYGHLNVISPWANNWMIPALTKYKSQPKKLKGYFVAKKMLFQLTLNTLQKQKPEYIIYFSSKVTPYIVEKNFNFIDYFSQNKMVRIELEKYKHYRKIDNYIILKRIDRSPMRMRNNING